MSDEKVRLGGMALANGVLVHGPTSWACAVRTDTGCSGPIDARSKARKLHPKLESVDRPRALRKG